MHTIHPNRLFLVGLILTASFLSGCHNSHSDQTEALPFTADGLSWGLVTTDGTIIQPVGSYQQRPSVVVGGMFSLPDEKGRMYLYNVDNPSHPISRRSFARIGHFFEDVAPAQEMPDSPILLIDKKGNEIASTAQYPQYEIVLIHNFSEGRALFATAEGKYGYMDTRGVIVIPPIYDRAYDFHEGLALTGNANSAGQTGYQLIDHNGRVKGTIRLSNSLLDTRFSDGKLLFLQLESKHLGFLDHRGNPTVYFPEDIQQASRCQWGTAVIQNDNGYGLISSQGHLKIPAAYENAHVAGKGLVALKKGGLWGIADTEARPLCRFQYDSIGHYYAGGYAVALYKGRSLFIDRQGEPIKDIMCSAITEDPTASRILPQRFLTNSSQLPQQQNIHTPLPDNQHSTLQPAQQPQSDKRMKATTESQPSASRIEQKDWHTISMEHPFYQEAMKVTSGKLEEKDKENRQMILNYVEHLRTSYTTKDIDFLEQLFSEHALIVVGTVVRTSQKETGYLSPAQVIYNVKSKRQYLDRLKQVFQANRTIDLQFSDFHIMRHPTLKGIYGVSLRQAYRSDLYSDDGYLFLLWDFRDETAPKIHVRTWQPRIQADHTPLPENEIFNIRNFNLQ